MKLKALVVAGIAAATLSQAASATMYINKRYCGGDSFATCAAVMLDVTGTTVTLRVWNLSGNTPGSYGTHTSASTVFNGIGLYNVPGYIDLVGGVTTTGPKKVGNSQPDNWIIANNKSIGFLLDFAAIPNTNPGNTWGAFTNGITSGCLPTAQMVNTKQFVNPCIDPINGSLADWVTFQFQVNQTWDASNTYVMLRGKDINTYASTECWTGPGPNNIQASCYTVTPEPMTMTLLATGLVGLGGVGYLRRRRRNG